MAKKTKKVLNKVVKGVTNVVTKSDYQKAIDMFNEATEQAKSRFVPRIKMI